MIAIVCSGEMLIGSLLAIVLLVISPLRAVIAVTLFMTGVVAWTLGEYTVHRFVLHNLAPTQHALHHARPDKAVLMVSWQIWVCFAIVYLVAGGALLAGGLVAYAWYLFVHHCAHHASRGVPSALLKHHQTHHRFATRNYGVSTTIWDHVFGTLLHPSTQATAHAQRRELAAPDLTRGER